MIAGGIFVDNNKMYSTKTIYVSFIESILKYNPKHGKIMTKNKKNYYSFWFSSLLIPF